MCGGSHWRRSLLRRLRAAHGAAVEQLAHYPALQDATAGAARARGDHGKAAIPKVSARASAVAAIGLVGALVFAAPVLADDTPPPATPTATTPDAPPPDPYRPPAKAKPSTSRPAPVVQSAPVRRTPAPVRSYTPAPVVQVRTVQPRRTVRPRPTKVTHKRKARVVHRRVAPKPKPVKVTFNPFAGFVAATDLTGISSDAGSRDRYLRYAGLAFALLAVAGLSLHLQAVRR